MKKTQLEKEYPFHYNLSHLFPYLDDWYGDFPVLLSKDEYDELLTAHKIWYKSEEWYENERKNPDSDDEYFLIQFCPNIHKKVRAALKEYAVSHWNKEIIVQLSNADIEIPDIIYWETDPTF